MGNKSCPTEAIIAVTMNCNARCVMCGIWKNKIKREVEPEFYRKLPGSLREINITGGEPFLRNDLPEIIRVIKETCPQARLLINTNGYLTSQIQKLTPLIKKNDPNIALRVSLDGHGQTHTKIRGLPNFFEKARQSLFYFKKNGIKDLGISYTFMEQNKNELMTLYDFCEQHNFEFSLTTATDSPIYFGVGKVSLRPQNSNERRQILTEFVNRQYNNTNPKSWVRAWFNGKLTDYLDKHIRYFDCGAGEDFFYLDSLGSVYVCNIKPWMMGSLAEKTFDEVYFSDIAKKLQHKASQCNDCWMICSVRSRIKKHFFTVLKEILIHKLLRQRPL